MSIEDFLGGLLTQAGGGVALWAIMALIVKAYPPLDDNSNAKFWIAFMLSFVIPPLSYGIEIWLGYATFTTQDLLLAIGTGYLISQCVHRGTEQIQARARQVTLGDGMG